MKMPKSKRGAWRQYEALYRAYRRDYAGGGMFGLDWPTWRMNQPDVVAHIEAMRDAFKSLPN